MKSCLLPSIDVLSPGEIIGVENKLDLTILEMVCYIFSEKNLAKTPASFIMEKTPTRRR